MDSGGRDTIIKNPMSRSIGSGIKSLTNTGKEYYVLEHKTNSGSFRAGAQKEIIVDYIELGRDAKCAIRFSSMEQTVSRRHAAIQKTGNTWMLINLSAVNPTLLNGRPVKDRFYLNSGDDIQLSVEGPRLGFIVPSNNTTGSLGLGKRMSLFREQALRPYKRALYAMAAILLLIATGSGYAIYDYSQKNKTLAISLEELKKVTEISTSRADSLEAQNKKLAEENTEAQSRINSISRQLRRSSGSGGQARESSSNRRQNTASPPPSADISQLYKDIYHVRVTEVKITHTNGEVVKSNLTWSGTGFLTKDKRFITARHVVEPWFYPSRSGENQDLVLINILKHNYGAEIEITMEAVSPSQKKLKFRLRDFKIDRKDDLPEEMMFDGSPHVLRSALKNPNDIAWAKVNEQGDLVTRPEVSENLRATQELYILGYPLGIGASNPDNMTPLYSTATVGRPGLENGSIITTSNSTEKGNSGGPVFIKANNRYEVVGVVSGGWGQNIGRIVPIASIY
jgi:hypothetical protein